MRIRSRRQHRGSCLDSWPGEWTSRFVRPSEAPAPTPCGQPVRAHSFWVGNTRLADGFPVRPLPDSTNPRASVWDLLSHPELGDVRSRPYTERRALLLDLLHDVPPPIQAVPATDDPEVAQLWYDTLQSQGIEGVVCKRATSPYRAGRIWCVNCTKRL
ncbi:hypothetical protein [Streptomyces sp. NPDC056982]|uniref:ATP-dependent DNA ligase n=1 Tax=Streptomyces sp. NPDC056982 TaxID=3345986 RepID=UPI00363E09BC